MDVIIIFTLRRTLALYYTAVGLEKMYDTENREQTDREWRTDREINYRGHSNCWVEQANNQISDWSELNLTTVQALVLYYCVQFCNIYPN